MPWGLVQRLHGRPAGGDHRGRCLRPVHGHAAEAGGPHELHHLREGGGPRGHLEGQHLPGGRLRHPLPPLLLLVRPQARLAPQVRQPGGDPLLSPGLRAALRAEWIGRGWRLSLADGEQAEAQFVVAATGQLSEPSVPELPGLGGFRGASFHSARWDHGHDLEGQDVAVVGTGASAIQLVPELARVSSSLTIYQRTPNWVLPKPDREFSRLEKAAFAAVPGAERLYRWLVYWTYETRFVAFRHPRVGRVLVGAPAALAARSRAGPPPPRPDYPVGCKRILISNDWFRVLERPSVELVTDPIEEVTAHAVVAGGRVRRADAIIFATGFRSTAFLGGMEVVGKEGRTLAEVWQGGAWAYLGVAVPGFPNLFLLYGPNTNLGHSSILFMVERQVAWALRRIRAGVQVDVDPAAATRYQAGVERRMGGTVWSAGCRSWYKTPEGRVTNNWPSYTVRYWWETKRPRPGSLRLAGKEEL